MSEMIDRAIAFSMRKDRFRDYLTKKLSAENVRLCALEPARDRDGFLWSVSLELPGRGYASVYVRLRLEQEHTSEATGDEVAARILRWAEDGAVVRSAEERLRASLDTPVVRRSNRVTVRGEDLRALLAVASATKDYRESEARHLLACAVPPTDDDCANVEAVAGAAMEQATRRSLLDTALAALASKAP